MRTLLLLSLLAMMFVSCDEEPIDLVDEPSPCEGVYDTISIDTLFITLYEDCSGTPAAGRMIIAEYDHYDYDQDWERDTLYTDANGKFQFVWYGFCEDGAGGYSNMLEFYDPVDSFSFDVHDALNENQYFIWSLVDTVKSAIQFQFLSPYNIGDTLWYARHYTDDIGFITAPFSDTLIYLPLVNNIDLYHVYGDSASTFFDWGIGWENFHHTYSILQPGEHQVEIFHTNCNPVDEAEIIVE